MAIMYLSKENFTCLIVQFSIYLTVLKQINTFQISMKPDINSLVNIVDPDQLASEEASWSAVSTLFSMQHVTS